jgi:hypothetical protein
MAFRSKVSFHPAIRIPHSDTITKQKLTQKFMMKLLPRLSPLVAHDIKMKTLQWKPTGDIQEMEFNFDYLPNRQTFHLPDRDTVQKMLHQILHATKPSKKITFDDNPVHTHLFTKYRKKGFRKTNTPVFSPFQPMRFIQQLNDDLRESYPNFPGLHTDRALYDHVLLLLYQHPIFNRINHQTKKAFFSYLQQYDTPYSITDSYGRIILRSPINDDLYLHQVKKILEDLVLYNMAFYERTLYNFDQFLDCILSLLSLHTPNKIIQALQNPCFDHTIPFRPFIIERLLEKSKPMRKGRFFVKGI